jgi:hypothetical protein
MTSVCLEVLLMLHRANVPLDRDIIFLAEAGEEATTRVGIDFMVEKQWDKIACEFALNEGGGFREENGKVQYLAVAPTEKVRAPFCCAPKDQAGTVRNLGWTILSCISAPRSQRSARGSRRCA